MTGIKRIFRQYYRLYIWLISVLSILSISWLGDLIAGGDMFVWLTDLIYKLSPALHPYFIGTSGTLMALVILTLMSFYFTRLLYQQGQAWFRPVTSLKQVNGDPAKALIFNVSTNTFVASDPEGDNEVGIVFTDNNNPESKFCLKQASFDEDFDIVQSLDFRWNWQTIMKSIKENINPNLQDIILVFTVSGKDEHGNEIGAIAQQQDIEKWLERYPELGSITWHSCKLDVVHADIEKIYAQYCDCIELLENKGIDSRDIVVGVTSGTADMSIAASMATLHKKAKFECLNQSDGKLYKYDLVLQRPLQE